MRIVFPCLLALVLTSVPALQAQQAPAADKPPVMVAQNQRRPVPVATPLPREVPKKRGMLDRLLGRGKKEATTPAPEPAATPAPTTPKPRPKRRTTTARQTKPEAEEDEKPAAQVDKNEETPAVTKKTAKPKPVKNADKDDEKEKGTEEAKPEVKLTAEQQAVKDAEAAGNPVMIEKAKYDEVKSRALQDEKVVALKEKADSATNEEEGRKALRAYNKALFQKMRSLDSSISERVDLMEDAVMKRLEPAAAAKK